MKTITALLLLVLAVGCGDSPSSPSPPPAPQVNAQWHLSFLDVDIAVTFPRLAVTPDLRLAESMGTSYTINSIKFVVASTGSGLKTYKMTGAELGYGGTMSGTRDLSPRFLVTAWEGELTSLTFIVTVTDIYGKRAELQVQRIGDDARAIQALIVPDGGK